MRYLPTPFNASALFIIIYALYTNFSNLPVGDGLSNFWVIQAIGLAIVLLLIDYFIQRFVKKYKFVFMIESIILAVLYLFPFMLGFFIKANTLNLTPESERPYCVMIYDVKNADKVFIKGERDVPPSNVLYNPKKQDDKQRAVHFYSDNILAHAQFDDVLSCNSKFYNYRAWFLIMDRSKTYNEDSMRIEIEKYLLTQCDDISRLESGRN